MNDRFEQYAIAPDAEFSEELRELLRAELDEPTAQRSDDPATAPLLLADRPSGVRRRRRTLWVVAVAAAAVTAGGLVLASHQDGPDREPQDSVPAAPRLTDQEIADASLLSASELGEGWFLDSGLPPWRMSATVAAAQVSCRAYLGRVFEPEDPPAVMATVNHVHVGASALSYVRVFPDEAAATSMLDVMAEPAFEACFLEWGATVPGETNRGNQIGPRHRVDGPPFTVPGDQGVVFRDEGSWQRPDGRTDPDPVTWVFARIGRVVTLVALPSTSDADEALLTAATRRAVERVRAALDGRPLPSCSPPARCPTPTTSLGG